VERWGTGALNIDECRIPVNWKEEYPPSWFTSGKSKENAKDYWGKGNIKKNTVADRISDKGRSPANCVTTEPDAFFSKYFNVTPPELSKKASKKDRNSDWRGE